jgi:Tfp pilus assembly protein PilE
LIETLAVAAHKRNKNSERGLTTMKIAIRVLAVAILGVMLCSAFLNDVAHAQGNKKMTVLQQADAAYAEKSYARALELYRRALQSEKVNDRDEVEFRIAVSLGKTEKWDAASRPAKRC